MLKPAAETPTRHAHLPLTALPYVFTEEETNLGREGDHLWSIDPFSDSSAKPSKRRRREITLHAGSNPRTIACIASCPLLSSTSTNLSRVARVSRARSSSTPLGIYRRLHAEGLAFVKV
jgi:hypothetical protein